MQIYNEKREFKTKDELLQTLIRECFEKADLMDCDELVDMAKHFGYNDLAREMQNDLNSDISYFKEKRGDFIEAEGERLYEVSRDKSL
jgi:hypothetical protein